MSDHLQGTFVPRRPTNGDILKSSSRHPKIIPGSLVSLDGESLMLPSGSEFPDEMSSMNSSIYQDKGRRGPTGMNINTEVHLSDTSNTSFDNEAVARVVAVVEKQESIDQPVPEEDEYRPGKATSCIPLWIKRAPFWLKLMLVASLSLLVAASVLVGLGVGMSKDDGPTAASQNVQSPTGISFVWPTNAPTLAPSTMLENDKAAPSVAHSGSSSPTSESVGSVFTGTPTGALLQNAAPSAAPTNLLTSSLVSSSPTEDQDMEVVTFYVTGGKYFNDVLELAPERLQSLPTKMGTSFLVNVGDWNSPSDDTRCDEKAYSDVDSLFSNSSIPVYFVPGDNEYNDCDFPDVAFSHWQDYLLDYETKYWDPSPLWSVSRQSDRDYEENFEFVYNGVIFVGINLVAGTQLDEQAWQNRLEANLDWIDEAYTKSSEGAQVMVIFAHGAPGSALNAPFYASFFERVADNYSDLKVVLIHRNLISQTGGKNKDYQGIPNLEVVVAEGAIWPPLRVEIDFTDGVEVRMDQEEWYDKLVQGG